MAFSDPQSVTIDGTATSLARTSSGVNTGGFTANDGTISMVVQHSYGKRYRRAISIQVKKYATDPTDTSQQIPVNATIRLTVDQPIQGYTVAELTKVITGFLGTLTASSNANITKLLGGEN